MAYVYAPLGEAPGLVTVGDTSTTGSPVTARLPLPPPLKRRVDAILFTPTPGESAPLVPPVLRPGPGSAARFVVLYTLLTWGATFALNLPWLPWLLWADYGPPIFSGTVPVWWLYVQTANFVFWNVFAVTAQDDYFSHDCVDLLRRLGVPHNRQSTVYRLACGWWPRDLPTRTAAVSAVWTALFGGVPLLIFLVTPPYHKEHASKVGFVGWVTLWSSAVGSTLAMLVAVRAAGEGTSSSFYVRTNPRMCFQSAVFRWAYAWSGVEHEITAITRISSKQDNLVQVHSAL